MFCYLMLGFLILSSYNKLKSSNSNEINKNKETLANLATDLCHGKNTADNFVIKKKDFIKGIQAFQILCLNKKIVQSNSESRRLIRGWAVKLNGELINDELKLITNKNVKNNKIEISIDKKNYFTIKIV